MTQICPSCHELSEFAFSKKHSKYLCPECGERFDILPKTHIPSQTIFLSYAHKSEKPGERDISEKLVNLVKTELVNDGHTVWIDKEGIRSSHYWREKITEAILSHDHFLAFLSKRSVRQEPNVCLNEVAIAIKNTKIIQTIFTESEDQISAPLTLTSIQWLNFQDWENIHDRKETGPQGKEEWDIWFGKLMNELRQGLIDPSHKKALGELAELKKILRPTTFDGEIVERVDGFFGRKWLFEAVDGWLKTDNRLFWLKGSPGIGKSSFAAKLVHTGNSSIVGFFKCNFQGTKSVEVSASECIRTLAFQLASRLPDYRIKLLRGQEIDEETVQKKTPDDLFTYLITEPLNRSEKIAEAQKLALVIDALDEAGRIVNGQMVNPLADLLYKHADSLPPWLGVIITSRPEAYLQQQLSGKFSPLVMEGDSQNNLTDIKDYLEEKLDQSITGEHRAKTIAAIIEKSSGTFLYIKRVEELKYDLSKPSTLPNGLDDLFYKEFKRYFPELGTYEQKTEKFLRLLTAAPGPLPKEMARELLGWEAREITQYVTQPMASLLTETKNGLQFFHQSIGDWLQNGVRSGIYQVNGTGAKELGDFLCKHFLESNEVKFGDGGILKNPLKWKKQVLEWLPGLLPHTNKWADMEFLNLYANFLRQCFAFLPELEIRLQHAKLAIDDRSNVEAILDSMDAVFEALINLGRYEDAREVIQNALKISKNFFAPQSIKTGRLLKQLGLVQLRLGNYLQAAENYNKTLEIMMHWFGPDHEEFADVLNSLGIVERYRGNHSGAVILNSQALEIMLKVFDPKHVAVAGTLTTLGNALESIGDHRGAIERHSEALKINKEFFGAQHPSIAIVLTNLGKSLHSLGHYAEAVTIHNEALEITKEIFGVKHLYVARVLKNFACALLELERYAEAHSFLFGALEIEEAALGSKHPKLFSTLTNLAKAFDGLGDLLKADELYRLALEISEASYGPKHDYVVIALTNLADVLHRRGSNAESQSLIDKANGIKEELKKFQCQEYSHSEILINRVKGIREEFEQLKFRS